MKSLLIVILILLSFVGRAEGQNESWYFNLGFGSSSDTFPSEIQAALNAADGTEISLILDIGFYSG